jgi:serine/threonine protein phosphatase PrpC
METTEPLPPPVPSPAPDPEPPPPAFGLEPGAAAAREPASPEAAPFEPAIAGPVASEPSAPAIPAIRIDISALSDIGCVRTNNEDFFGYDQQDGVYVVCDGMGGSASGEVASASAVSTILKTFRASAGTHMPVSTRLLQAIVAANSTVWMGGHAPEHRGMGTTVVAAALDGDKLVIGNVGDSRAYILEAGRCMQLTVDHSYVNELIRNGTITLENAHRIDLAGMQSIITRAIGAAAEVQPDFFSVDLRPGTLLLLSTDGLTRYLLQEEIGMVLANSPFESVAANLIQLAKDRGGQDNITCLLLRVS